MVQATEGWPTRTMQVCITPRVHNIYREVLLITLMIIKYFDFIGAVKPFIIISFNGIIITGICEECVRGPTL